MESRPYNLSLHEIAQDYINNMIQNVKGMKGIIMDKETQTIFALETSKSLAIKEEIFLFENIEKLEENQKYNINGIFFIRPTEANINLLGQILQFMNFKEIHLNFTNFLSDENLKKLAQFDEHTQIKSIQEVYLDYYIMNSNFYHLGLESSLNLTTIEERNWQRYEYQIFNRIVEGIISVCLSNRVLPVIKCVRDSPVCKKISRAVTDFFEKNFDFVKKECGRDNNGILFLFDRKEDPVTPLLNQWSYQAMLHELIGINNNICEIRHKGEKIDKFPLNDYDDKFFINHMNSEFDLVADEIEKLVVKMNKESFDKKVDSIQDLKKFIQSLPEKKKESAEFTKHTYLFYELSEIMQRRKLLELSTLEQDLACYDNKKEHYNKIVSIIKDIQINPLDKAKLYMLYCFRYEEDSSINNLRSIMYDNGLKDWTEYSDYLHAYAGKNKRALDVLSNKDFLAKSKNKIFSSFGIKSQNIFFQHMSYLNSVLERVIKGKTKENEVETVFKVSEKEKVNKVIVFTYGGATYEEARNLSSLSKTLDIPIIFGGTYIHNSKS
jgi:vacuolar protein sorting-associated protein 45